MSPVRAGVHEVAHAVGTKLLEELWFDSRLPRLCPHQEACPVGLGQKRDKLWRLVGAENRQILLFTQVFETKHDI